MRKLKSIKLYMTFLFTGLFTYLLIIKSLNPENYVSLMTIIVLSYFGANVGSKFVTPKE